MQYPVKPAKVVSIDEAYTVWVATNDADCSFLDIIEMNKNISVFVSVPLMRYLLKQRNGTDITTVQVADCKQNIAWWSRGYVKSNIISLSFVLHDKYGKLKNIKLLDAPVVMTFNVEAQEKVTFTSEISQLDNNLDLLNLDLNVKILRLDLPRETVTEIMFLYPPTQHALRVLVSKNNRPGFVLMMKKATFINETSPLITIKTFRNETELIHYLGILPGPEVPASERFEFTLEINTFSCQLWTKGRWAGRDYHFSNNSLDHTVTCSGTHLSLVSVGMPGPPYSIEPYVEFKMFLDMYNNYLIVVVTSVSVLLYFFSCVWARRQDAKDELLRVITILDDNYSSDRNPYLVAVWTGWRLDAGSTAHVALKLHGEDNVSRTHVLSSGVYKVLRRNTDNWFVILSPEPLGNLYLLQIWHDNYGSSPDWYCDKICVYDLNNKVEYLFLVDQWVAHRLKEYPEVAVLPAYIGDLKSRKRKFIECLHYGMREDHLVTSILLRHARSCMSRLQRITILMCCVMIALAWSVFFFASISHPGVDDWSADVAMREILLAFQILAINVIFTMLITFSFTKSTKFAYEQFKLMIRSESTAAMLVKQTKDPSNMELFKLEDSFSPGNENIYGKSVFERFVRSLYSIKRTQSMLPVHLAQGKITFGVRKRWHLAAWIVCISIILFSCVFNFVSSLGIGFNQSQKCIFSASLAITGQVFVFAPLMILLSSLLFTLGLRVIKDPPAHNINKGDLNHLYKLANNEERYLNITKVRSLPMYKPITKLYRNSHHRRLLRRHRWSMVIDFLVISIFIVSLSSVISHLWSSLYYANHHTKDVLSFGHSKIGTIDLSEVNNVTDMFLYLQGTFIRAVFELRWYNGQLISDRHEYLNVHNYKMSDYTRKMIGRPLVRQLRVKPIPCNNFMEQGEKKCIPLYSFDKEDRNVYGVSWMPAKWMELERENSPWQYKDRSINWVFKQFNCFGGTGKKLNYGGYMVHLSPLRFESVMIVTGLQEEIWLDRLTRAVVTHVTVYDVNVNLFSHTTSYVEFPDDVQSVHKTFVFGVPGSKSWHWADFLCIMAVIYFFNTAVRTINKNGPIKYMSAKENVMNILVVLLSTMVISMLILHFYRVKAHLGGIESAHTSQFEFDDFAFYFKTVQIIIPVLVVVTIIQMFLLLKVGSFITQCYYSVVLSMGNTVITLAIFVVFVVVQWRVVAFLLDIHIYQSTVEAFTKSFTSEEASHFRQSVEINYLITQCCIKITTAIFTMLFLYYIKIAKTRTADPFNFLTFIVSEMKGSGKRK